MKMKHIVLLKFKEETTPKQIEDCFSMLGELKSKIPGIESFSCGPYSSHEGLNQGFTHVFEMSFSSAKERDDYLVDPEHQKVASIIVSHLKDLKDVVAFDYHEPTPPPTPRTICDGAEEILAQASSEDKERTLELLNGVKDKLSKLSGVQTDKKIPKNFFGEQQKQEFKIQNTTLSHRIKNLLEKIEEKIHELSKPDMKAEK